MEENVIPADAGAGMRLHMRMAFFAGSDAVFHCIYERMRSGHDPHTMVRELRREVRDSLEEMLIMLVKTTMSPEPNATEAD